MINEVKHSKTDIKKIYADNSMQSLVDDDSFIQMKSGFGGNIPLVTIERRRQDHSAVLNS